MTANENAATRLAALLRSYATPNGQTPESVRGFSRGTAGSLEAWRAHHEAAELVATVDRTLHGMSLIDTDISPFTEALPRWYAGVHYANLPWGSRTNAQNSAPREACSDSDLRLLDALGLVLKTGGSLTLDEDNRRHLVDVLAQARKLIDDDTDDLPPFVRSYLAELIRRAQMIVENLDKYGAETVRQVAFELGGAMAAQADRADQQQEPARAGMWRATATNLIAGFSGGVGGTIAGALTEGAIKSIGGS